MLHSSDQHNVQAHTLDLLVTAVGLLVTFFLLFHLFSYSISFFLWLRLSIEGLHRDILHICILCVPHVYSCKSVSFCILWACPLSVFLSVLYVCVPSDFLYDSSFLPLIWSTLWLWPAVLMWQTPPHLFSYTLTLSNQGSLHAFQKKKKIEYE